MPTRVANLLSRGLTLARAVGLLIALFGALALLQGVAVATGSSRGLVHITPHGIYVYDRAPNDALTRPVAEHSSGLPATGAETRASPSARTGPALVASPVAPESEAGAAAVNSAGEAYPNVLNPGTGEPIPYPGEGLTKVPVEDRVPWGAQERGAFIKEWYDRGFSTPEGGWPGYDIHHIIPREYGGTNDFENLVPVERGVHQSEFNAWWRGY